MGQKALEISQQSKFERGIALSLLTKGVAYAAKGNYTEALSCHLQSMRISEKIGLEGLVGDNCNDIGILYTDIGEYSKALDFYIRALKLARKFESKKQEAAALVNIAEVHKKRNAFDSAIFYNTRALAMARDMHDSLTTAITLSNIGDNYNKKNQPEKALPYLEASLRMSEKIGDNEGIATSNNLLAGAYHEAGQYRKSIDYAIIALSQAKELGISDLLIEAYHTLYTGYKDLGDFEKALEARNGEIALKDSLYSLAKDKELKGLQSDYDLERKQHQIDLLKKDKLIQQSEITRERVLRYVFIGVTLLFGLLAFMLFRSNALKQRLNKLLKAQNMEIVMQNKQLEDLNAIKNKLLSIIGHDLRSPISSLKALVDLLKSAALSEEQIRHFTTLMSNSLVNTSHLLDNLLFWAKSQMDGMSVNARPFDLIAIVRQNRDLVKDRAEEKAVQVIVSDDKAPVMVYADEVMVDMVIRNLVENAIKFSRSGDTVRIIPDARPDLVTITVSDTGLGIQPEDHSKIFNRFVSYTTSGTSKEKGSGLGLSLCKELVEKNGGRIWFESQPGKGTAFIFTLPVHLPDTTTPDRMN